MSEDVAVITDANFDTEVLKSNIPVLVDFWAAWWTMQTNSPVIDELAKEYKVRSRLENLTLKKTTAHQSNLE